jgi:hypothetical protein
LGEQRPGQSLGVLVIAALSPGHGASTRNIAGNGLGHFLEEMAGATGLEPATFGVTGRHSNQLSYAPASTPKRGHTKGADVGPSFRQVKLLARWRTALLTILWAAAAPSLAALPGRRTRLGIQGMLGWIEFLRRNGPVIIDVQ